QVRERLRLNARVSRVAIVDADKAAAAAATATATAANKTSGSAAAVAKAGDVEVVVHRQVVEGGSEDGAEEEEEEELVRGEAVIMAVPLSVLQEGTVEFDPPLSEETSSALSRLSMGNYEKIIMEFAEPFWPADTPFIGCCCRCPRPPPPSPPSPKTALPATQVPAAAPGLATADRGSSSSPASPGTRPTGMTASKTARMAVDGGGGGVAPASSPGPANQASLLAAENGHSPALVVAAAGRAAAAAATAAAATESAAAVTPPLPASPVFLENHLWSKGVPVLTAAVTGEPARMVSAAARTMAAAAAGSGAEEGWRASHAREMYRRLVKPALVEGLGREGEELPEPVSVFVTSWGQEPFQRGSYSFFPLGARDDDIHTAGRGAAFGPPGGSVEGGAGGGGSERVFFAGEATVPGLEGSMHGAYLSGVRAAEDVAYAFGLPL
ncbi:unnamed protein product, partial [Ectocarpus fasciculatus]